MNERAVTETCNQFLHVKLKFIGIMSARVKEDTANGLQTGEINIQGYSK
jgi:hypothetical protein